MLASRLPTAHSDLKLASTLRDRVLHRWTALSFAAIVLAAMALRVVAAAWVVPGHLFDDGYITFRYAANISMGEGFVYNPGEKVLGTTTPLFTMLLSLGALALGAGQIEFIATFLNLVAFCVFLICVRRVLQVVAFPQPVQLLLFVVLGFYPFFIGNSLSGMETPLVLALMGLTYLAFLRDHSLPLGICGGLLYLGRPDSGVFLAIVGIAYVADQWRASRLVELAKAAVAFFTIVVPWHLFMWGYFGVLLPQSVKGKIESHGALEGLDLEYAADFLSYHLPLRFLGPLMWPAWVAALVVVACGAIFAWIRYPKLRPLIAYWFVMSSLLVGLKAPLFSWYFPPVLWVFWLLLCFGANCLLQQVVPAPARSLALATCGALLACLVVLYGARSMIAIYDETSQPNPWLALADVVAAESRPTDRIFLEHIGLVGRNVDRTIVDPMGLVSPEALQARVEAPGRHIAEILRRKQPQVAVLYPDMIEQIGRSPSDERWFAANYRLSTIINTDVPCHVYLRTVPPAGLVLRGTAKSNQLAIVGPGSEPPQINRARSHHSAAMTNAR